MGKNKQAGRVYLRTLFSKELKPVYFVRIFNRMRRGYDDSPMVQHESISGRELGYKKHVSRTNV